MRRPAPKFTPSLSPSRLKPVTAHLGNSLRRVLLSSLEGAAITSIKIDGAVHEFATLPHVVEDVTDIVLNLKRILFKAPDHDPRILSLTLNKEGEVTAADIQLDQVEMVNTTSTSALSTKKEVRSRTRSQGRPRFCHRRENKNPDQAIGVIAIDSLFSPVTRVNYAVENTRVGQRTDYDKLILEIWTDGRITPDDALMQASAILQHHLDLFVDFDEAGRVRGDASR